MCGILIHLSNNPDFVRGLLLHRGPDEQYVQSDPSWQIEYFRLAITGLIDGKSPALSSGRRYAVYLNGEVYNFRELQIRFRLPRSNSDSVTLANLVESQGIDALVHIRGMYAFVIHDVTKNLLYVARDPLGEKPLFLLSYKQGIILGSEFRAVLKIAGGSLQLDQTAIKDYLRFNYVEEPYTFDRRIRAFPKGQLLKIDPGNRTTTRLLNLDGYSESDINMPLEGLLSTVLDEAITTEVPSALSLSSGLDSSSILVRKMLHPDSLFSCITLHTGLDSSVSELVDVQKNAKAVGAQLDIVSTDLKPAPTLIRSLVAAMDQPICDPSALNYYMIFERARELSKKVVLLGQGPDEFFWGYPHYYDLLPKIRDHKLGLNHEIFLNVPQQSSRLLAYLSPNKESYLRTLNSEDVFLGSDDVWQLLRANMVHGYLSHNGFAQIDRLSMHFSVEARSPLADSRIYGWAQHNSFNDKNSFDKAEFKNAINLGPLEYVKNMPKKGFRSDIDSIVGSQELIPLLEEAYIAVFKDTLIDWRFKYPKFLLSRNEKWKILVLGLWLESLKS
jgi:asparagine synthase (glutamine-hydrolysing)